MITQCKVNYVVFWGAIGIIVFASTRGFLDRSKSSIARLNPSHQQFDHSPYFFSCFFLLHCHPWTWSMFFTTCFSQENWKHDYELNKSLFNIMLKLGHTYLEIYIYIYIKVFFGSFVDLKVFFEKEVIIVYWKIHLVYFVGKAFKNNTSLHWIFGMANDGKIVSLVYWQDVSGVYCCHVLLHSIFRSGKGPMD